MSGERRKARLNSWPEMKGKLSLGGWNAFLVLRGLISCASGARSAAREGSGLPQRMLGGLGGMRGRGTGREKLLQDQPGAGERLPGGCERQIFLILSQEILFRLKGV